MTSPLCTWTGGRIQNMDSPGPWTTPVDLQSWTKVPGTVLQYSYISVISRFPLKTMHPFQNFLAVLPPPTLYKVETLKKFWIHKSNIVGWGEGLGLCELENASEMQKCPKTFVHDCSPWIPLWTWAWTTSMDHPYFWRWILLEVFKMNLKNLK